MMVMQSSTYNLLCNGRSLAESLGNLDSSQCPVANGVEDLDTILRHNGYFVVLQELLDIWSGEVALVGCPLNIVGIQPPFRRDFC